MNAELMLRVADAVESENVRGHRVTLNMHSWHGPDLGPSCGTTACIGGYVDLFVHEEIDVSRFYNDMSVFRTAQDALDLTYRDAWALMTDSENYSWINRNKDLVPDALRWMAMTGEISWGKGLQAARCVRERNSK